MAQSRTQSPVRRMLKLVALVAALAFGIKIFILYPVYTQLVTNVSHMYAWYTDILYYLSKVVLLIFLYSRSAHLPSSMRFGVRA